VMVQYSGSTVFAHRRKFLNKRKSGRAEDELGGRWQSELGRPGAQAGISAAQRTLHGGRQGRHRRYMLIWDIVYGLKLYEVAAYNVDTNFSNNLENVTMNLKKWQASPRRPGDIQRRHQGGEPGVTVRHSNITTI